MGYPTRKSDSLPLPKNYPSLYKETQINNWTPVDIVVTYHNGRQEVMPRWPSASVSPKPYVEATVRSCNGYRINQDHGTLKDIPIPTETYTIFYEDFVLYPVEIKELGIVISTAEHSLMAKNMVTETRYIPDTVEHLSDFNMTDPRFVFEVKDTCNRWNMLYVNIMGQTIKVKCSHWSKIPDIDSDSSIENPFGVSTLTCYLRYPTDYQMDEPETVQVFTINLKDIDLEEPYLVPSGDIVCVASSMEALQRVINKRNDATHRVPQVTEMVPLEVHKKTVEQLENKVEEVKTNCTQRIQTITVRKDSEIANLKAEINDKDREIASLKQQNAAWSALHSATMDRAAHEDKLLSQVAKSRDEAYDRIVKRSDSVVDTIKVLAAAIAGLAAIGVAVYKAKKG